MVMERSLRPVEGIGTARYMHDVLRRYAATKALTYPQTAKEVGTGVTTRDALIDAMRVDAGDRALETCDVQPLVTYVDLLRSDRAKSYAWWYALLVEPIVHIPYDTECTGVYVETLRRAEPEMASSLEEYMELTSRHFTHAEVDRCITELRVAHRYLNLTTV